MATNIVISDVTDGNLDTNGDWAGTGVFDVLMDAVNKNIESQYIKGRIVGSDYANVYLGSLQAVLAQSMDYVMKEKLTEAQVDNMVADTGFKEREIIINELNAEKQRSVMDKDIEVKERSMVVQESELADKLLTSTKQRDVMIDELAINVKKKAQLDAQTAEIIDAKARANTQLEDQLLTTAKQRDIMADELAINTKKKYQLDAQTAEITDATIRANTQLNDQVLTAEKQRSVMDKDIEVKTEQKKLTYTERVMKDKATADLGLDNVYRQVELEKADPDFVYTPKYIEV